MRDDSNEVDLSVETEEEAAAWFARLRGPDRPAILPEFEAWLSRSEDNRKAYARISRLFDDAAILRQSRRHAHRRSHTRQVAMLAAASLLAGLAVAATLEVMPGHNDPKPVEERLAARHGEIRTLTLADGSRVTLDTGSTITVAFGSHKREVHLQSGRARFSVAPDSRPFEVIAGAGRLRTGAGVFDVAFVLGQRVTVTSLGARIEAAPTAPQASLVAPVQSLVGGSTLAYSAADFSDPRLGKQNLAGSANWPSGWVSYRSIPLSALVAEANRYAFVPIVIDDPAIGRLEASGRFHLTDTDSVADNLAEVFDLAVVRDERATHLKRR